MIKAGFILTWLICLQFVVSRFQLFLLVQEEGLRSLIVALHWDRLVWAATNDKTNKITLHPPVWSESSLSAWRILGSLATHRAHSEDSDQTVRLLLELGKDCLVGNIMTNNTTSKYQMSFMNISIHGILAASLRYPWDANDKLFYFQYIFYM